MSSHYVPHTKIPALVFPTSAQASRHVALMIESLIRQNNSANRPTVLGLATGSTPVGLYRELIRLHKEAGLDFSRVITFNLDEYFPIPPDDPHSYNRWMSETFFQHVNIRTPQWLGYIVQRPESHSLHHGRGIHQYNYSDLPLFDIVFRTFRNPKEFVSENGFYDGASAKVVQILLFKDIAGSDFDPAMKLDK